jgi:hypothetical protein
VAQNFGAASATPSAAPGGPNLKAPGFAGGYLLDEFSFRFNRRTSGSRGLLFLRLMQQAVDLSPVPAKEILRGITLGLGTSTN